MKKIGIFYGSTTGVTEKIAKRIGEALGVPPENVFNVKETSPSKVGDFDVLILGSSTWGSGELQEDWYDFLDGLQALSLKDKEIAIFGCGDENMSDSFCNAVGIIYRRLLQTGEDYYFGRDPKVVIQDFGNIIHVCRCICHERLSDHM